ncbi:MAG: thioredoxin [Candidatus Kerfeldbacteria bacterium]|nr:thioredoxin [Candidatus Kerfeldbacteria bacterium]
MSAVHVTDETFDQEVLKSDKPVLVDFWAEWCGPCQVQAPIIEQVAGEFEGKAKVAKLEVDESPVKAQEYGIMSIPTLAVFKGGKIVWQASGIQTKETMASQLNAALA